MAAHQWWRRAAPTMPPISAPASRARHQQLDLPLLSNAPSTSAALSSGDLSGNLGHLAADGADGDLSRQRAGQNGTEHGRIAFWRIGRPPSLRKPALSSPAGWPPPRRAARRIEWVAQRTISRRGSGGMARGTSFIDTDFSKLRLLESFGAGQVESKKWASSI